MSPLAALRTSLALAACCAAAARGAAADTPRAFAVRARAIYTATREQPGPIEHGVMIVRDGRVAAIGANMPLPADVPLIDLGDDVICPGFVSAGGALSGAHGGGESVSGLYAAIDAFDPFDPQRPALARGTTTAHLSAGPHRLVSGVGAIVKLGGVREGRVLVSASDLCVNLGVFSPPAVFEPPFYASSDVAIEPAKIQRPASRLGMIQELREQFERAALPAAGAAFDAHAAALRDAWTRRLPLRIEASTGADLEAAAKLAGELRTRYGDAGPRGAYLIGGAQAGLAADALRAAGLPIVVRVDEAYHTADANLGRDPDAIDPALEGIEAASRALTQVALAGAAGDKDEDLRFAAILAVRSGMAAERALAAITRVPAEILGVSDRVGSLAPGRDADFLVLNAAPLDLNSFVRQAYVDGALAFNAPPPASTQPADKHAAPPMVVRGGRVWVGDGRVLSDGQVLIENGRIQAVGPRVPTPPLSRIIEAGADAFIVPGFIDAHGHLGLEGDTAPTTPDVPIERALAASAGRDFRRVARAGVTTVLVSPYRVAPNGGRVAAIKTYGEGREHLILKAVSGVKFSYVGRDPHTETEAFRRALESGRKYQEAWAKYEKELADWKAGKAKPAAEPSEAAAESAPKVDPITGVWKTKVSGEPLPEPVDGEMRLRLTGNSIEGRLVDPASGEEEAVSGTLDGEAVTLEVDVETPLGKPTIKATLGPADRMTGTVSIGTFSLNFEAERTDKGPVEFKVSRGKRRSKDGRPEPPKVDESLEPLRPLLAGTAPAVVEGTTGASIVVALKLFVDDYKVRVVLVGGDFSDHVAAEIAARGDRVGVAPPPPLEQRKDRQPYTPVVDYSRRGVRVALQSNAEDGARGLALMGLFAARQGMGGDAALRALTSDAAAMYGLSDRVGSLEPGRDGDVLIFRGHPFDADSRLERVIVGGREVPDEEP